MLCYNTAFLGPLCSLEALGSRMSEANKELRSLLQGLAHEGPRAKERAQSSKGYIQKEPGFLLRALT